MELDKSEIDIIISLLENNIVELKTNKDNIKGKIIAPDNIVKELTDSVEKKILFNKNLLKKLKTKNED